MTSSSNHPLLAFEAGCARAWYGCADAILGCLRMVLNAGAPPSVATVMVFRTGSIGDVLCALPACRALRARFPSARLILLTQKEPIFDEEQTLHSLIGPGLFDEIVYYRSAEDVRGIAALRALVRRLRGYRVDVLVYFGQCTVGLAQLIRDMFFFRLIGRRVIGFRLGKHRLFRLAQARCHVFAHESVRLMRLLAPLGIHGEPQRLSIAISAEDKQAVDRLWPRQEAGALRPVVVIHPWAKYQASRWPTDRFLSVARTLIKEFGARIVLLGGTDALSACRCIAFSLGSDALNLCTQTNFPHSAEVISRAALLVSCDSGPVHLAEAVGTPVVAIFSARDYPRVWFPRGPRNRVIRRDPACQVCLKSECDARICTNDVTADEVMQACRAVLGKEGA